MMVTVQRKKEATAKARYERDSPSAALFAAAQRTLNATKFEFKEGRMKQEEIFRVDKMSHRESRKRIS